METIPRKNDIGKIQTLIRQFPITGLLGPRQCGKTFLAKLLAPDHYFDLEKPSDLARLDTPQLTLEALSGLIIIDEIQRKPDLFPLLRVMADNRPDQKYLILGSASQVLIKESSETLAGRIAYYHLGGFTLPDIGTGNMPVHWFRGGLPRAYLAGSDRKSSVWLEHYVTSFLERDIPALGIRIPAYTLRRFWTMLAHYHGQVLNYSELANSFGISDMTVRKYIDILTGTFMVRLLMPWFMNTGKRVVKRPKLYLRDAGIFHSLMSIEDRQQLQVHNKLGASWEGYAMECVASAVGKRPEELFFWKTHAGAELDVFWQARGKNWGVEIKYTDAPKVSRSMRTAVQDLGLQHLWVVYPGKDAYPIAENVTALPITAVGNNWRY